MEKLVHSNSKRFAIVSCTMAMLLLAAIVSGCVSGKSSESATYADNGDMSDIDAEPLALEEETIKAYSFPVRIEGVPEEILVWNRFRDSVAEVGVLETVACNGDIFVHPGKPEIVAYQKNHPAEGDVTVENLFLDANLDVVEHQDLSSLVTEVAMFHPEDNSLPNSSQIDSVEEYRAKLLVKLVAARYIEASE